MNHIGWQPPAKVAQRSQLQLEHCSPMPRDWWKKNPKSVMAFDWTFSWVSSCAVYVAAVVVVVVVDRDRTSFCQTLMVMSEEEDEERKGHQRPPYLWEGT